MAGTVIFFSFPGIIITPLPDEIVHSKQSERKSFWVMKAIPQWAVK
jgi:hypothetical protein